MKKNDMESVLDKLVRSDIIVLATPVYFYCMNSQMKMMIGRCLPRYLEIENKKFWLITTAAEPQHAAIDGTLKGLRGFFGMFARCKGTWCYIGNRCLGKI